MDDRTWDWLVAAGLVLVGITIITIGISFIGLFCLLGGIFASPPVSDRVTGSATAWATSIISFFIGVSTAVFGFRGGILLLLVGIGGNPFVYQRFVNKIDKQIPRRERIILLSVLVVAGFGQLYVATAGTFDPIAASESFHDQNQTLSVLPTADALFGTWTVSSLETDGATATRILRHSSSGGNLTLRATATAYDHAAEARETYLSLSPNPSLNEGIERLDDAPRYGNQSLAFKREGSYGVSFYHSNMYVVIGLSSDGDTPPDKRMIQDAAAYIDRQLRQ